MTFNLTSIKSYAIYVLGLAGVVVGAIPAVLVPTAVHAALVSVGGIIVAVERYIQGVAVPKAAAK